MTAVTVVRKVIINDIVFLRVIIKSLFKPYINETSGEESCPLGHSAFGLYSPGELPRCSPELGPTVEQPRHLAKVLLDCRLPLPNSEVYWGCWWEQPFRWLYRGAIEQRALSARTDPENSCYTFGLRHRSSKVDTLCTVPCCCPHWVALVPLLSHANELAK
jgi:hypothetical protein